MCVCVGNLCQVLLKAVQHKSYGLIPILPYKTEPNNLERNDGLKKQSKL